jgi:hypothetical protein
MAALGSAQELLTGGPPLRRNCAASVNADEVEATFVLEV